MSTIDQGQPSGPEMAGPRQQLVDDVIREPAGRDLIADPVPPTPNNRKRNRRIGGAVAAVVVAGGSIAFAVRGGGEGEAESVLPEDGTELAVAGVGVELETPEDTEFDIYGVDVTRELNEDEIQDLIDNFEMSDEMRAEIESRSPAQIQAELNSIDERLALGVVPYVEGPFGYTLHSDGFFYDETNLVNRVSLDGEIYTVTYDEGLRSLGLLDEPVAAEAEGDQGVVGISLEGENPIPEFEGDPNDPGNAYDHFVRLTEHSLQTGDRSAIASAFADPEQLTNPFHDTLMDELERVMELNGIERDDVRLIAQFPVADLAPPEKITNVTPSGYIESGGEHYFGTVLQMYDIEAEDNGEPFAHVWTITELEPTDGELKVGTLAIVESGQDQLR